MKSSIGTIGIGVSILVMLQFIVFDGVNGLEREEILQSGSVCILVAILMFVAGALTFRLPRVGGLIFAIAAFLAFLISNAFPEMAFWGSASLILGTLAGFSGWKEQFLVNGAKNG